MVVVRSHHPWNEPPRSYRERPAGGVWWWNAYAAMASGRLPPWMSGKVMSPPAISLTNAGVLSAANHRVNKSLILSEGMKSLIGWVRLILLRQTHCRSADRA